MIPCLPLNPFYALRGVICNSFRTGNWINSVVRYHLEDSYFFRLVIFGISRYESMLLSKLSRVRDSFDNLNCLFSLEKCFFMLSLLWRQLFNLLGAGAAPFYRPMPVLRSIQQSSAAISNS